MNLTYMYSKATFICDDSISWFTGDSWYAGTNLMQQRCRLSGK